MFNILSSPEKMMRIMSFTLVMQQSLLAEEDDEEDEEDDEEEDDEEEDEDAVTESPSRPKAAMAAWVPIPIAPAAIGTPAASLSVSLLMSLLVLVLVEDAVTS